MVATLAQLLDDSRSHLDETIAGGRFWSDTELTRWVNEGCLDVARRSENLQANVTIDTTTGTSEYTAPTNTLRLHHLEWSPDNFTTSYPLEGRSLYEMDSEWGIRKGQTQAYPSLFATSGYPPALTIILYPVPSQTGKLKVYYYKTPTKLVNTTDVADIPGGWEDLVPLYVEYVGKRKDHDGTWQEAKQLYEERLKDHISLTRRWHDQAGMISTGPMAYPAWLVEG